MADRREIVVDLLGKESVSTAAKQAERGLGRLGDQMSETAQDARRLDREIEQAQHSLRDLAVEYARTEDAGKRMDLSKQMRRQQTEVRRLTKVRDLLPDLDGESVSMGARLGAGLASGLMRAGQPISQAISNVVGTLPPQAQAAIGAAVVTAVVAVAPAVGAALTGAVLGGVGVGGVAGGLALAAKDSRVQAAAHELGATVSSGLEQVGGTFVGPAISGISTIRTAWDQVAGDVQQVGQSLSRYVEPLAEGVAGAVRAIMPGIQAAADAAGPVMREIGASLPRIGAAIGDLLTVVANNADAGAGAIQGLTILLEHGITWAGNMITILSALYRAAVTAGEAVTGWLSKIPVAGKLWEEVHDRQVKIKRAMDDTGKAAGEAGEAGRTGLMRLGEGAETAATKVQSLDDKIRGLAQGHIAAEQAAIALETAIDKATEAAKRNGDGIDRDNPKQRANREALIGIASAANAASQAILDQNGSYADAETASNRGRTAFLAAAEAMGVSKREAQALADKLFALPATRGVTISVEQQAALDAIRAVQQSLGKVTSKSITIGVYYKTNGDLKLPGGTQLKGAASGGPVEGPGPRGVDSVPMMLAPGEHVLTAREVDAAGGHAGVERMRSILRGESPAAAPTARASAVGPSVVISGPVNVYGVQDVSSLVAQLQEYARRNGPIRLATR